MTSDDIIADVIKTCEENPETSRLLQVELKLDPASCLSNTLETDGADEDSKLKHSKKKHKKEKTKSKSKKRASVDVKESKKKKKKLNHSDNSSTKKSSKQSATSDRLHTAKLTSTDDGDSLVVSKASTVDDNSAKFQNTFINGAEGIIIGSEAAVDGADKLVASLSLASDQTVPISHVKAMTMDDFLKMRGHDVSTTGRRKGNLNGLFDGSMKLGDKLKELNAPLRKESESSKARRSPISLRQGDDSSKSYDQRLVPRTIKVKSIAKSVINSDVTEDSLQNSVSSSFVPLKDAISNGLAPSRLIGGLSPVRADGDEIKNDGNETKSVDLERPDQSGHVSEIHSVPKKETLNPKNSPPPVDIDDSSFKLPDRSVAKQAKGVESIAATDNKPSLCVESLRPARIQSKKLEPGAIQISSLKTKDLSGIPVPNRSAPGSKRTEDGEILDSYQPRPSPSSSSGDDDLEGTDGELEDSDDDKTKGDALSNKDRKSKIAKKSKKTKKHTKKRHNKSSSRSRSRSRSRSATSKRHKKSSKRHRSDSSGTEARHSSRHKRKRSREKKSSKRHKKRSDSSRSASSDEGNRSKRSKRRQSSPRRDRTRDAYSHSRGMNFSRLDYRRSDYYCYDDFNYGSSNYPSSSYGARMGGGCDASNGKQNRRSKDKHSSKDKPKRRSRSKSKKHAGKSRSPSPTSERIRVGDDEFVTKKDLYDLAKRNVEAMLQSGTMQQIRKMSVEEIVMIRSGGKSVTELVEYCSNLARKQADKNERRANRRSSSTSSSDEGKKSEEDKDFVRHPFNVKPATGPIIMNIRNAVSGSYAPAAPMDRNALRQSFPVSSGSQHRHKELTWVPVDEDEKKKESMELAILNSSFAKSGSDKLDSATATAAMPGNESNGKKQTHKPIDSCNGAIKTETSSVAIKTVAASGAIKTVAASEKVFQEAVKAAPILSIGDVVSNRLKAIRKLQENANDSEALKLMHQSQEQMSQWAESKNLPGQFTGSTGVQDMVLTATELGPNDPRRQAWARKDTLSCCKPLESNVGMHLLQKMGWKPGEGLGKNSEGSTVPLMLDVKSDRKGLTAQEEMPQSLIRKVVRGKPTMAKDLSGKHPVSALMELCSKRRWDPPSFQCQTINLAGGFSSFLFKVVVKGVEYQPASPVRNKKDAKMQAAQVCLQSLGLLKREDNLPVAFS